MKKASLILIAVGFILLGAGCVSSGKAILEQKDPIALVSLVSNWDINWKGEASTNPNAIGFFSNRALQGDSGLVVTSSADELINTAETLFWNAVNDSSILNLADKGTVLSSRAYREAKTTEPARNTFVKPSSNGTFGASSGTLGDGYRFINSRDRNFPAALANETGIQRSMFVEFDFTKSMVFGFGKNGDCRADVDMTVRILDNRGKTLYNKTFSSWSGSTTKVSAGAYSQTELMELFEEAINDVCHEFIGHL